MESKIITLVENAKKGDTDAFSILYQIFYPKMKGICIKILKEDKDDVDDLVQDAFILALAAIKNLKNSQTSGLQASQQILLLNIKRKTIRYNLSLWLL